MKATPPATDFQVVRYLMREANKAVNAKTKIEADKILNVAITMVQINYLTK
jgi:hypothetical protein